MDQSAEKVERPLEFSRKLAVAPLWIKAGLLAILVALLYYHVLIRLVANWWADPNFSHGFFVPAFSALVIWREREKLAKLETRPSWLGLAVMAAGLGTLIVGTLGAELFLSRSSLLLVTAGLLVHFLGWRYFRTLLFPWAFLLLMIPIPTIVFNQIAFPLQLLASRLASGVLDLFGVPVFREGNIINLPAMSLEVVQACSGIRSLMSLATLAVIYGYFLEQRISWRVCLAVGAVPIAILTNSLRIVGTGLLVHYWDPARAEGFFHTFEGWVIFILSLILLFSFHSLMRLSSGWWARRRA